MAEKRTFSDQDSTLVASASSPLAQTADVVLASAEKKVKYNLDDPEDRAKLMLERLKVETPFWDQAPIVYNQHGRPIRQTGRQPPARLVLPDIKNNTAKLSRYTEERTVVDLKSYDAKFKDAEELIDEDFEDIEAEDRELQDAEELDDDYDPDEAVTESSSEDSEEDVEEIDELEEESEPESSDLEDDEETAEIEEYYGRMPDAISEEDEDEIAEEKERKARRQQKKLQQQQQSQQRHLQVQQQSAPGPNTARSAVPIPAIVPAVAVATVLSPRNSIAARSTSINPTPVMHAIAPMNASVNGPVSTPACTSMSAPMGATMNVLMNATVSRVSPDIPPNPFLDPRPA